VPPPLLTVTAAVEGDLDEAVVRRLIRFAGGQPGDVYGKSGKGALRGRINGYRHAARRSPWIVLVDLDQDAECAPAFRAMWDPDPVPGFCLRVAVRQVEAWLLADHQAVASFLAVAPSRVPPAPEQLIDAKRAMVDLARFSRRREIVSDVVPRPGSGRTVGRAYTSHLVEFVGAGWRPEVAACRSDSLRRAIGCLERLVRPAG